MPRRRAPRQPRQEPPVDKAAVVGAAAVGAAGDDEVYGGAPRRPWYPADGGGEGGLTAEEEAWMRAHPEDLENLRTEYDPTALERRKQRIRFERERTEQLRQAEMDAAADRAAAAEREAALAALAAAEAEAGVAAADAAAATLDGRQPLARSAGLGATGSSTRSEEELLDSLLGDVRGGVY